MTRLSGEKTEVAETESRFEEGDLTEDAFQAARGGHAVPIRKDTGEALVSLDPAIIRRARRKMDLRVPPALFLAYLFCFLDRINIGNARLAGLEASLDMHGNDFNIAVSAFFVAYIVFEIPSNAMAKIIGPGRWLPILTFLFGSITTFTCFVDTYGQLIALRVLLGIAEAGLLPGIGLYATQWYTKEEVALRIAFIIVAAPVAGAIGGLFAYGVLQIHSIGYLTGWRMLFFVEGLVTTGLGVFAWFFTPNSIARAKWLTEEERAVMQARLKAENAGTRYHLEKRSWKAMRQGLLNANSLMIAFWFLWIALSISVIAIFLPTLIAGEFPRYSTVDKNLLTVPVYVAGAITDILVPLAAWKFRNHAYPMLFSAVLMFIGNVILVSSNDPLVLYGGVFFAVAGTFPGAAMSMGWAASNAGTDSERSMAIAAVNFLGNCGNLIGSWTVLPQYAPYYRPAQGVNLAGSLIIMIMICILVVYQKRENALRDKGGRDYRLEGLSEEEVALLGSRHPLFRYRL